MRHVSAPVRLLTQAVVVLSGTAVAGLVSLGPAAPPAAAQTSDSVTVNATAGGRHHPVRRDRPGHRR